MLRVIENSSSAGAKSYFSSADYYSEGQELTGIWRGKGAARLGLSGEVGKREWDLLCDNRDPGSGKTLTARQKVNRRIGYDFTFDCPKSVSLLYGLTGDQRLLDAFRESVRETMEDVEAEMRTRVRRKGRDEDRTTGNAAWGEYVHFTARPVDGVPDPHLHAHCFVFNATFDGREERWKAGQFAGLKRDAPYFDALMQARLAHRLEGLGLPVHRTRTGWDLDGISPACLKKFSRRTERIEAKAREEGITDPAAKGALGARTRERKAKALAMPELMRLWRERLSDAEDAALKSAAASIGGTPVAARDEAAKTAALHAIDHCFERSAVVPYRALETAALKFAVGKATPEEVKSALKDSGLLTAERDGQLCATTADVLEEEARMVAFAREGRGTCAPLASGPHVFQRDWLNAGQRAAVEHVLHSPDRVMLVRGVAGTGKTTMMQETCAAIEAAGTRVAVFAPSADASRGVLREEGFEEADTVARLLKDKRMQAGLAGHVLWIDEAGLLSSRTMDELFELVGELDARVVLSGDRRQHGSVERGAALRLLEEEAGVRPAEIKEIMRQKGEYKRAVQALSEGKVAEGFRLLDDMGWVREIAGDERYRVLADDYVSTVAKGQTALIVSPTHAEAERTTQAVRETLKANGRLGIEERTFSVLKAANLTQAERSNPANFARGDVLVFNQTAKGHRKGERIVVGDSPLPTADPDKFQLYHPSKLSLSPGDVVRITKGGETLDGNHELRTGATYAVKGFDWQGNVILSNGWTVAKDFGFLSHGYCVTSHASQGRTVDHVFIAESSQSFRAASREQLYVSISRGRRSATIYTDDKDALKEAVGTTADRVTATELLRDRALRLRRLPSLENPTRAPERDREPERAHG